MLFKIKHHFSGAVLFSLECGSFKLCLEAAIKAKTDLSGSDLRGSDLSGSDLRGSNLRGSNLRWSDLSGSNLSGSDLRGSNLRGSDLRGSNLRGSNLRDIKIEWSSHQLISEILFRAAGNNIARRIVAGLIRISTDWCWDQFLAVETPEREWAIDELRKWVKEGDGAPDVLKAKTKKVEISKTAAPQPTASSDAQQSTAPSKRTAKKKPTKKAAKKKAAKTAAKKDSP